MVLNSRDILDGTMKTTYRNVPCCKCPFDYTLYQRIIFDIEPDLIIEIGTHAGGSALYMADLLDIVKKGIVHTIDIHDILSEKARTHPRIKNFIGGWKNYDVKNAKGFAKVLIIDDGSHMYQDVLGALNKFNNLIVKGSYFIIEDSVIDEWGLKEKYDGAPLKAIEEFLIANTDFEIDRSLCDFYGKNTTFNVNGYLKRIK